MTVNIKCSYCSEITPTEVKLLDVPTITLDGTDSYTDVAEDFICCRCGTRHPIVVTLFFGGVPK